MNWTAGELAAQIGARLEGNPAAEIRGIAAPESAAATDLIYVESEKFLERARASAAICVLLPEELCLEGKTQLRVAKPKLAFAQAAEKILSPAAAAAGAHPAAVVAPGAKLGEHVSVGPFAVIEEGAEIGARTQVGAYCFVGRGARIGRQCVLHPRVTLCAGVRVGDRVVIHSGAVLGSDGFGYVFGEGKHWKFPQVGGVEVEDDVEIGANTTVDRGSLATTRIGAGTKIDNLVQVAHNVRIGTHSIVAAQTGISGSSEIGAGVLLGGQVGIADGCHVEDGAIVGAQAGVPTGKTIRKGQVVWGTPARPLDRFKKLFALYGRLPEILERLHRLESALKDRQPSAS